MPSRSRVEGVSRAKSPPPQFFCNPLRNTQIFAGNILAESSENPAPHLGISAKEVDGRTATRQIDVNT